MSSFIGSSLQKTALTLLSAVLFVGFFELNDLIFYSFEHKEGINWLFLPAGFRVILVLVLGLPGALGGSDRWTQPLARLFEWGRRRIDTLVGDEIPAKTTVVERSNSNAQPLAAAELDAGHLSNQRCSAPNGLALAGPSLDQRLGGCVAHVHWQRHWSFGHALWFQVRPGQDARPKLTPLK
jgi:hypothetical protein